MSEEDLRREAVRRRLGGENPADIAAGLGRTTRWVRNWVARYGEESDRDSWAQSRSRAPHSRPGQTSVELERQILDARARLVADPRAQYGSLAIQWELRRLGVEPIPPARTIERVLARNEVSNPKRRTAGYVPKDVPYPAPVHVEPGTTHQIDMVGPRHLYGGAKFHALNLIDVGSHLAGNDILTELRPSHLARSLAGIWCRVGVPTVAQFDDHTNFRGAIPPAWQHFSPIVATCLDLGVIPRFIPLREPWRNGVVEHFNNVWDKSFFRTETYNSIDHLRTENATFIEFHNTHHRYSVHNGATPNQVWNDRLPTPLSNSFEPPTRLPAKGRIEVVRFVRSNRRVELFGKRITVAEDHTHQNVTAIIKVRAKRVAIVTRDGEIIHDDTFNLTRTLR